MASSNSVACLRCSSLGLECSFEHDARQASGVIGHVAVLSPREVESDAPLVSLQKDVKQILSILQNEQRDQSTDSDEEARPIVNFQKIRLFPNQKEVDLKSIRSLGSGRKPFEYSPFSTVGQLVSPGSIPILASLRNRPLRFADLVERAILTRQEACYLLQNFRDRYGRWVSFPEYIDTETLLDLVRSKSPLLLSACCTLSLRYSDPELRERLYDSLLRDLQIMLEKSILYEPHSLEFIQALSVLSIYGISLSTDYFPIDPWLLSGIALQHFATKDCLGELLRDKLDSSVTDEFQELTCYRVWNHLSLVHLVNCNLSGRSCLLDELRLNLSRKTLELPSSTNFDGRMIAEICLQLIVYNFTQCHSQNPQPLSVAREELRLWLDTWGYLFEQPANQFVEMGYHYGYLLILYTDNFYRVVEEPTPDLALIHLVLSQADSISMRSMLYHAQKVLDAINSVRDNSYFAFLSDQIHFFSLFASLMLLALLKIIQTQPQNGLDSLDRIEMSKSELLTNLSRAGKISKRFKIISTTENDTTHNYARMIEKWLVAFPEFDTDLLNF